MIRNYTIKILLLLKILFSEKVLKIYNIKLENITSYTLESPPRCVRKAILASWLALMPKLTLFFVMGM